MVNANTTDLTVDPSHLTLKGQSNQTNPIQTDFVNNGTITMDGVTTPVANDTRTPGAGGTGSGDIFDLALRKTYVSDDSIDGLDTDGVVAVGNTVTFAIYVENQGNADAFDIDVIDHFGPDFASVALAVGAPTRTIADNPVSITDAGGGSFTIDELESFDGVTFDVEAVVSPTAIGGTTLTNWAEISDGSDADNGATTIDVDSTPDTTNQNQPGEVDGAIIDDEMTGDGKNGGDEDDHDPAAVTMAADFDLALIKTYVSDDSVDGLDTDGVIEAGDTVTFSLTVENQGDVAAFDIDVTDYIGTAFTAVTLAAEALVV